MNDLTTRGDGERLPAPVEEQSTKQLVRDLVDEGRHLVEEQARLVRLEVQVIADEGRQRFEQDVEIARVELKQEGGKVARGGGVVGAGGVLAHAALYLLLATMVFAFALVVPLWLACLIVAILAGGAAALLIAVGIRRIKTARAPRRTVERLQEDKAWMKEKTRALRSTIRANA
jgi:hypothetical protein